LETFRVNGLIAAASEQAAERERLAAIEQAAEQERLAAAKVETFRSNGLMEAASEQAVGTKMGPEARINQCVVWLSKYFEKFGRGARI
jgi:hypothetical protein